MAKPSSVSKATVALVEAKLSLSGLTLADLAELGGETLDAHAMSTIGGGAYPALAGILFRYWDPFDSSFISITDFHRVRILEKPSGFQIKMPKYMQPKDSLNHVYVPNIAGTNWPNLLRDANLPLIVTEGELKAACATKLGFPCIGLGGVTMIEARKKGLAELPFFTATAWKGREVTIIFDTDEESGLKPQVYRAALRLAELLLAKGAIPRLATLPFAGTGQKMGLDDYLIKEGVVNFSEKVLGTALGFSSAQALFEMGENYYWVKSLGCVLEMTTRRMIRKEVFLAEFGNRTIDKLVRKMFINQGVKAPGYSLEVIPRGEAFLKWEARPDVDAMVYEPGNPSIVDSNANMWKNWACEPIKGDISPFLWTLDNVFGDDPVAREFIEDWFLYPLKYPGTKLYTIALVTSPLEGIGKTFPGEMLARFVYGMGSKADNASILQEGDLGSAYNSFLINKQFIVGDDIAGNDAYTHLARIKGYVTNEYVTCKQKYIPEYTVRNRANAYLTSNHVVSFRLSDDDRRFFVHSPERAIKDVERYVKIRRWFEHEGGAGMVLWHAQNKYDEGRFLPQAAAPHTKSRALLIELGRTDLEDWLKNIADKSEMLTRVLATPKELLSLFNIQRGGVDNKVTEIHIGRSLAKLGIRQWHDGKKIWHHNTTVRVYVFKDHEAWHKKEGLAITAELEKTEFKMVERRTMGKVVALKKY